MASAIIMSSDIPKVMKAPTNEMGQKCQTEGVCQHGGECFVDKSGNDQCVCPQYTSGKYCEYSHVFTVCNEPDNQRYCRKGGTCMVNNLTGNKACLYDQAYINDELDIAKETRGDNNDYNAFKLKKLEVIEFASLIVGGIAMVAVIAVIAGIIYKRRQRNCKTKKYHDTESNSSDSKRRRNSQTSNEQFQMVVDTKGQNHLLPREKDQHLLGSVEPLLASRSTNDLREKRCSSPVFRALPEGYVGSFEDINKRQRLHATYDDTHNNCPRRHKSVEGRIGDEERQDDMKLSPHALRRLRMNKSNTTGHYRARSPTISDVPCSSVPVIVVEHREDCHQSEPSTS